jgi:hypothetical protein
LCIFLIGCSLSCRDLSPSSSSISVLRECIIPTAESKLNDVFAQVWAF